MKVAAVQFAPEYKAFEKNLKAAARLVVQAARDGAKLIVLPELCTTGYSFLSAEEAAPFAEVLELSSRTMSVFGTLAKKLGVGIAWGQVEKDVGTGDLYNSQGFVIPSQQFWSYRKVNSWGNDYLWSKPGTGSPPIAEFEGKRVGLLICADIRDASDDIETFYEPGDADIVCFSANWGDGGFPAGKWVKFAKLNATYLVVSNRYGRETCNNFGEGGICIIEPSGKVHCQGLKWSEPCIVFAEVP